MQHDHRAVVDGKSSEAALKLVAVGHCAGSIGLDRSIRWEQTHVRGPATLLPALGVAGAHEEPVRPGVEARRVAKLRKISPDGEQRLLRRVLGELDVTQNSMRDGVEPITCGHGKAREGLFVAALCSSHQIGIHASSTGGPGVRSGPARFTRYGRIGGGQDSIFGGPRKEIGGHEDAGRMLGPPGVEWGRSQSVGWK